VKLCPTALSDGTGLVGASGALLPVHGHVASELNRLVMVLIGIVWKLQSAASTSVNVGSGRMG
jgi:hypothetical protein